MWRGGEGIWQRKGKERKEMAEREMRGKGRRKGLPLKGRRGSATESQ